MIPALYAAVYILVERFSLYRKAISCKEKKDLFPNFENESYRTKRVDG